MRRAYTATPGRLRERSSGTYCLIIRRRITTTGAPTFEALGYEVTLEPSA
jgi:hypothetical protein